MKLLLICNIYQKIFWTLFSLVWCGFRHVKTNFQISIKSATLDLWQYNTTRNAWNVSISYFENRLSFEFYCNPVNPFCSLSIVCISGSCMKQLFFVAWFSICILFIGFTVRVLWRWLKIERKIDTCASIVLMKRCFVLSCRIVSFAFRYKGENGK